MTEAVVRPDPGSWRDPFGFVYRRDGVLLRQVNHAAADEWRALAEAGLLDRLEKEGLFVPHEAVDLALAADPATALAVIRPEPVAFISYPYEWTFGELKAAALLTLEVQRRAVEAGFELRDASAYNVQFHRGRPLLIDTLSLRRATPGTPWIAYRQFCEHFLAPLALMAHRDIRLGDSSATTSTVSRSISRRRSSHREPVCRSGWEATSTCMPGRSAATQTDPRRLPRPPQNQ